jgi:hypothetical protein
MKTPIILLAILLCVSASFRDASEYRTHIHNKNFKPVVKT